MNQTAQGLASLGRGNDSMLMHVTPNEVAGLQSIAMANGGSLTVNPHTGLPEAGFFDSIFPTVAGLGLNAMFPGLGALGSGLLVGGITALSSGDLGKGLMAGFGAGAGAGLGNTFAEMGKGAVGGIPGETAINAVKESTLSQLPSNVAQNAASNLGMFNAPGATATMGGVGATVPTAVQSLSNIPSTIGPGVNSSVNAMGAAPTSTQIAQSQLSQPSLISNAGNRLSDMSTGFGKFASDPFGSGYDAYKAAGGKTMDLLSPVASVAMDAMTPEPLEPYVDPDTGKYRGPQGQLNLSDRFSTGLRLAEGGTISSGGIRDLYGSSDNQTTNAPSIDGYGLGRLSNLANEQAMNTAKSLGYAEGGKITDWKDFVKTPSGLDASPFGIGTFATSEDGGKTGTTYEAFDQLSPLQKSMMGITFMDSPNWRRSQDVTPTAPTSMSLNLKSGQQEPQMAKGGYLDGQGDGMSDSIPATIEGKQPARLADGEFVVPADVVSHLGNGSSKAGSKRLYAMLDKVRQARTGHTKQGKEIKPEKYMPA